MSDQEESIKKIEEAAKKAEEIYNDAIAKIKELDKKEREIISNFMKKLEQKKAEEIKKKISELYK